MRTRSTRTGFTFWQFVTVLAVLALLFAICWPVFQPIPMMSRRATCQSNLKQLGLAFIQYEQDADQRMPPGVNANGNGWAGEIYPFVKTTGVYRCPEDKQDGSYVSYAENALAVKQPTANLALPPVTVLLYETTALNCDPSMPEANSGTGINAPQNSKRHDQSTFQSTYSLNFLAMDCHVKYLRPTSVSSGPNAVRPKQIGAFAMTFAIK